MDVVLVLSKNNFSLFANIPKDPLIECDQPQLNSLHGQLTNILASTMRTNPVVKAQLLFVKTKTPRSQRKISNIAYLSQLASKLSPTDKPTVDPVLTSIRAKLNPSPVNKNDIIHTIQQIISSSRRSHALFTNPKRLGCFYAAKLLVQSQQSTHPTQHIQSIISDALKKAAHPNARPPAQDQKTSQLNRLFAPNADQQRVQMLKWGISEARAFLFQATTKNETVCQEIHQYLPAIQTLLAEQEQHTSAQPSAAPAA